MESWHPRGSMRGAAPHSLSGPSFINWEGWWVSNDFFGEAFSYIAPSSAAPVAEATAERAYIRFHGRNRDTWKKRGITANLRFNYWYTTEDFKEWESQTGHPTLVQRRGDYRS